MKSRPTLEQMHLSDLSRQSRKSEIPIRYQNNKQEVFVYEDGELTSYIDTRVINEHDDRLVNLAEKPYKL